MTYPKASTNNNQCPRCGSHSLLPLREDSISGISAPHLKCAACSREFDMWRPLLVAA